MRGRKELVITLSATARSKESSEWLIHDPEEKHPELLDALEIQAEADALVKNS